MINETKSIFFSIILPTYNVAKHIDRCLESCVKQTYTNFEVIVVDDCGTDDSIKKADQWAELDSRIKIVRNPKNLGTYHARRHGVEEARGDYIVFLDPDDALDQKALELISCEVYTTPVDIVLYGVKEVPVNNKRKVDLPRRTFNNEELLKKLFLEKKKLGYGTPGKAFLKATLHKAYDAIKADVNDRLVYAEDALLFYTVSLLSNASVSIAHPLYIYFREFDSITNKNSDGDVIFKSKQVCLVVSYIYRILYYYGGSNKTAEEAGKKVIGKLLSDGALIKRNVKSYNYSNNYLKNVYESFKMRGGCADIIRIICYVSSLGRVKL
ncbi:glycosyltransferase family 2 protein [Oceanisphaera sp.]|uniref:glycosyltransferase family 2 protein n=1 Tax=Oceanisphaera sp. TaxID=1929979 RepID=UPI003A93A69D